MAPAVEIDDALRSVDGDVMAVLDEQRVPT